MKQLFFIIPFSLFFISSCSGQDMDQPEVGINWMPFEEAVRRCDKEPKKLFIDVYTNWCGWCKRMDAGTFRDSAVVAYMNANYYAVKLDAETRDTLRFRENVFVYKPEYKTNELALSLLNGKLGYPSFVIMSEEYTILRHLSGYQTTEELMPILQELAAYKKN
jgi:thioredoxin-related protein